jgi:hypothetical protein
MAKVMAYHTESDEYPPEQRSVYHDRDDCPDGKQIHPWHSRMGKGSPERKRCEKCVKLG